DDQVAFFRPLRFVIRQRLIEREADEDSLEWARAYDAEAPLADEERLVVFDGPGHVGFVGVREAVGVLADDDVGFFEAEHALSLDSEGTDAVFFSYVFDGAPNVQSAVSGNVNFAAP